jgi:hypothetical protein
MANPLYRNQTPDYFFPLAVLVPRISNRCDLQDMQYVDVLVVRTEELHGSNKESKQS